MQPTKQPTTNQRQPGSLHQSSLLRFFRTLLLTTASTTVKFTANRTANRTANETANRTAYLLFLLWSDEADRITRLIC